MARFSLASLRVRLVLLVLFALVPSFGLIVFTGWEQGRVASTEVQKNALMLAREISADEKRLAEGARQLLAALAYVRGVWLEDPSACAQFLSGVLKHYPMYANFGLIKPDGDLACSARPLAGPINLADQSYFQHAVQTRDFATTDYKIDPTTGKATTCFGYPALDKKGNVRAVVFAALDFAHHQHRLDELQLPKDSVLLVVDQHSTVLARYPEPEKWVGKSVRGTPIIKAILAKQGEGTAEAISVDGVRRLFGFTRLRGGQQDGNVYLAVGIPSKTAFVDVNRILGLSLFLLTLVGLVALATAAVGGDLLIMRPVNKLVDATKRLAAGDLSARADLHHGQEELDQLGHAFDQMAEALDRRERLVRELPSVVYTVTLDRLERTLYISPQIEAMLGFSPAEWSGHLQLWAQQLHPDDRDRVLNERAYYRNIGGRFVSEYRLLSRSGRVVWVRDEGMVIRNETQEPPLLHGVMVDITERKRAEDQCQSHLQRMTVLREINAATTSTLDLQSVLNLLLEKSDSLLGYCAATVRLLNRETGELEPVACRNIDEEKWKTEMREYGWDPGKMAVENKILCTVQMPSCIKNCLSVGGNGAASCLGLPLVAKNDVLGILCLFTKGERGFSNEEIELLSLLAGEAAMAIYNSQLYEKTKTQALELEEAGRERADFTAMVVHDLSSPLTTVISGATMLEEGTFGPVNEEQRKWLVKIGASGCRVQTFVSKFLDLSRIESGHIELNKERTSLKELIENSLANYLLLARDKRLSLKISIDPMVAWIEADPRRLDQVLGHLLSNAVKFTGEGGEIEVGAAPLGREEIKVWVRDNGIGISSREMGSLFEMYRQPTNGNHSKLERRGIGLIICKMIVEAHGGKIWVESSKGKGATFFFSLPASV